MPDEFFLPPATKTGLWRETARLVAACYVFILPLAVVVTMPQGIVVRV